jgi:hypothetical protein
MSLWAESLGLALDGVVDQAATTEENQARAGRARAKVILVYLSMPVPRSWWQHFLIKQVLPNEGILGMMRDLLDELKQLPELADRVDCARLVALAFLDESTNADPPFAQVKNVYSPEEYLAQADKVLAQRPELKGLGERLATAIEKLGEPLMRDPGQGKRPRDKESRKAPHDREGRGKSRAVGRSQAGLRLVPEKTSTRSQKVKSIPAGVDEVCRYFADFLHREGFRPEIRPGDGLVFFKFEGRGYAIKLDGQDEEFFRIVFPNFWPIEGEQERRQVLVAADHVNSNLKVAKVFTVKDNVFATIEMFFADPGHFKAVFLRALGALKNAAESFAGKMHETE